MHEDETHRGIGSPSLRQVWKTLKENVSQVNINGAPLFTVPNTGKLGIEPRADATKPSVYEINKSLYQEGQRMGAVDSIQFANGVTAEVFTAIAASSHTIFAVPYETASTKWKDALDKSNYEVPTDGPFVIGTEDGHAKYIPTQLVTWIMLKVATGDRPEDFIMAPIDLYQIAQAQQAGSRTIELPGLVPENPDKLTTLTLAENAFQNIFNSVEKHVSMNTQYLKGLYNEDVLPEINRLLQVDNITLDKKEDTDIASTMALGYYRNKKKQTGLGGGPQSAQTAHIHTTAFPNLDELRKKIAEKILPTQDPRRDNDFIEAEKAPLRQREELVFAMAQVLINEPNITTGNLIEKIQAVSSIQNVTDWLRKFGGWMGDPKLDNEAVKLALYQRAVDAARTISIVERVFNRGVAPILGRLQFHNPRTFSPELIFKQVDPYSTIFKRTMDTWVRGRLSSACVAAGIEDAIIESFEHHVERHRLDMRVSEGWTIDLRDRTLGEAQKALNVFLDDARNLWTTVQTAWENWYVYRSDTKLKLLTEQPFELTQDAIDVIKQLKPTDQQLKEWIAKNNTNEEVLARLSQEQKRRESPRRIDIARRRITEGTLASRALAFGYYQVFGNVYTVENPDGTSEEVKFNKGYNIPGVPGFGITYEMMGEKHWKIRICPLLSEKAMAETYAGAPIEREKAREN